MCVPAYCYTSLICCGTTSIPYRDDLNKLVYISMCIKESMRLYPPVPFVARQLTEDYEFGDYKLKKGT